MLTLILLVIAAIGIGVARWLYPAANEFSIMRCTISFLGSPDEDRNPFGWRWYQGGMTALVLAMTQMVSSRHRNFRLAAGRSLRLPTVLYAIGLALVLVSIWVADSDFRWGAIRTGDIHNKAAVAAALTLMVAVIIDGLTLRRAGLRGRAQWPFRTYGMLWIGAIVALASWEWKCRHDPSLKHWPGDGIHSTPLWEWILFSYLVGFLIWISRRRTADLVGE